MLDRGRACGDRAASHLSHRLCRARKPYRLLCGAHLPSRLHHNGSHLHPPPVLPSGRTVGERACAPLFPLARSGALLDRLCKRRRLRLRRSPLLCTCPCGAGSGRRNPPASTPLCARRGGAHLSHRLARPAARSEETPARRRRSGVRRTKRSIYSPHAPKHAVCLEDKAHPAPHRPALCCPFGAFADLPRCPRVKRGGRRTAIDIHLHAQGRSNAQPKQPF